MAKKQTDQVKQEEQKSSDVGDFINPGNGTDQNQTQDSTGQAKEESDSGSSEKPSGKPAQAKNQSESIKPEELTLPKNQPNVGDPCPNKNCPGHLAEYSRHRGDKFLTQFLSCNKCNAKPKPAKRVTPY